MSLEDSLNANEKEEHMSEKEMNEIENLEIEPLSDDDLESVAGGASDTSDCSCCERKSYCTSFDEEIEQL